MPNTIITKTPNIGLSTIAAEQVDVLFTRFRELCMGTTTESNMVIIDAEIKKVKDALATGKLVWDAKANTLSPTFTGTPTAPTAISATNTTQIATTAFVKKLIEELIGNSPAALDTLKELATALGNDPNFATTMTNLIATKAPLASPVFTGTPKVGANAVIVEGDARLTNARPANGGTATTLTGLTPTIAELNFMDGVTSSVQTQLNSKSPSTGSASLSQLAESITLGGNSGNCSILQKSGTWWQKLEILDSEPITEPTFKFSESSNAGATYVSLAEIRGNGEFKAAALSLNDKSKIQYNETSECLEFIFP